MEVIKNSSILGASSYNEAEVRYHIVDPIIKYLGYENDGGLYIKLEEKLEYPYIQIGRRSKRDVPVGFPDYRAGLTGDRGSFIVEAKAGGVELDRLSIEQAHSYAAHPQVGANYFVLCNGVLIQIFETLSGPSAAPISSISILELNSRIHEIENILSPDCLRKNCKVEYDRGLKICDGLGSSVRVRSGTYGMSEHNYFIFINNIDVTEQIKGRVPHFNDLEHNLNMLATNFELRVSDGLVGRDEDGRIAGFVRFSGATISNKSAMSILGVDEVSFATSDKYISLDSASPTVFESNKEFSVGKGILMPQLLGVYQEIENPVSGSSFIKYAVYFGDRFFRGEYVAVTEYKSNSKFGPVRADFNFSGKLSTEVDI